MKKKIIIVLSIVSLLLLLGGVYLIRSIDTNASKFNEIIMFHQVEILRENLLLNIREVEADLYSQSTDRPESDDAIESHAIDLAETINSCFNCHHEENVLERLHDLRHQIDEYGYAVNKVLSTKADASRFRAEQENAHLIGDSLINKVNTMIVMTSKKLTERTEDTKRELHQTRIFLIMLVATGPILVAVLAVTVIRGVTGPIQALIDATRKLKAGNLEHRVEGLQDEFGELAVGFNAMSSSLKEQVKKIEESEKRYRLLFESAADAIFILEGEGEQSGKIVAANKAAIAMHGYSLDELLTLNIRDIDTPDEAVKISGRIRRIFSGEWIKMEVNHTRKDGTVFPVEENAGLLEFGNHRYVLAIDRDISERKQAEETLRRTEQLKVAGELATGLAHEIKNPLAGIKASIELLSMAPYLPEDDKGILVQVIGEIKRIEMLIKGLLNFARPSRPQFDDIDVNTVLDAVTNLVLQNPSHALRASRGIAIVRDFDHHLPVITADPMKLKQVFMNLLLNAVDAMHDGGTLVMKTRFDAAAHAVQIEISNTGREMDAAVMAKIFQPFFTTKPKGTGLGLAISKRLIEDHGGRIGIAQNTGGGAVFKIVLPVSQSERVPSF
ncbi:MAG TPA: PAS domain S-box protein [Nitrospirota bacterium]|nr:PAS domain S-box protein [Nitrospirota bacterium]